MLTAMRIDTLGRRLVLALVAGILVLGAMACGDDGDDDAAGNGNGNDTETDAGSGGDTAADDPAYGDRGDSAGEATDSEAGAITIEEFAFASSIEARPGSTLTITNNDGAAHTVTADNGEFDVGVDAEGTAELTAPNAAGEYAFHCAIHTQMTSTLVVKEA